MLKTNSYDTICHEHIEYYSLTVVNNMLKDCGLKIIDVQMNGINGGSFAVTASKESAPYKPNRAVIDWMLHQENEMGLNTLQPYKEFEERAFKHRKSLMLLIEALVADGKKVFGYGASTKGNVLLQFCGLTSRSGNKIFPYDPYKLGKNQYDQRTHHTLEYLASNLGEAIQTLHLIKRVLVSFVAFPEKTCGHGACPSCPGGDYKFYCSKPFNDIY
jgi:hypothetical protein